MITYRRMKLDPYLTPLTKITFKLIKDLNIKLQGENIEKKLRDIGLDNDFLDMITKAQAIKTKTKISGTTPN